MAILFSATALAQAPAATGAAAAPPSAEELTKLVGRIALYPDDLVAIILPAATSPLQIVQADRYLDKRKSDPKLPIDDKWDDPVKSLLNYPDVVKMMSNDLDWTSDLGEAVVEDQGSVLEAVQIFRRQAQAAGNLKSDAKQVVKTEKEVVIIEPADPQVVYVPQYNPSTVVVYGAAPMWGYYPTPYPSYYYPYAPGAAMAAGVIWGAAIGAAWSGNHYGWGGGNDININRNTNVNVGSGNTVNRGGNTVNRGQGGASGSSSWKSNKQPGQVSSSVGKNPPANRGAGYSGGGASRTGGGASASTMDRGGAGGGGANRGGAGGAGAGAGTMDRGGAGGGNYGGGGASRGSASNSAMGGYGSGHQTSMDSSRGASSRGSASGGGYAKPTASSGASRGGGGGGAARGGGSGGRGGGGRR